MSNDRRSGRSKQSRYQYDGGERDGAADASAMGQSGKDCRAIIVSDLSLEERLNHVSREEYERAYTLLIGAERAREAVQAMFDDLMSNPDNHVVLDPKFIALLALFARNGAMLASAHLSAEKLNSLQRDLTASYPRVREAFPDLLTDTQD